MPATVNNKITAMHPSKAAAGRFIRDLSETHFGEDLQDRSMSFFTFRDPQLRGYRTVHRRGQLR
jgi:hypothetical protein